MQEEQLQKAQNILFPNLSSLLHSLPPSPSKSQSNVQQTSSANAASKSSSSSNSLYPNLLNLQDNLGTDTVKTLRWMKLTSAQFHSLKDNEGRISDPNKHIIKQKIFKGGIDDDIRPELWKYLLGLFPFSSSFIERQTIIEKKKREYEILKNQWKTISSEQEENFSLFRDQKKRIEADVLRTDRGEAFFKDEKGIGLQRLCTRNE